MQSLALFYSTGQASGIWSGMVCKLCAAGKQRCEGVARASCTGCICVLIAAAFRTQRTHVSMPESLDDERPYHHAKDPGRLAIAACIAYMSTGDSVYSKVHHDDP